MTRHRSTIRMRLTALYAAAFFLAGAVLIALMYFYLAQSLHNRPAAAQGVVQQFLNERGVRNRPVIDNLFTAIAAQAERERQETLQGMLVWSLVSLGAVGVAAGAFGWLLAGRALQPLQNVTATARRVAERNLHERIALDGPHDEIKELADTFDAMLERLDRAFDGQHRFVANASHELRTPLAINRTLIEVALDDPAVSDATRTLGETLLEVNRRNERLMDGLLVLAKGEQRLDTYARLTSPTSPTGRSRRRPEQRGRRESRSTRISCTRTWLEIRRCSSALPRISSTMPSATTSPNGAGCTWA
jgi:signal transduction histidine kinase